MSFGRRLSAALLALSLASPGLARAGEPAKAAAAAEPAVVPAYAPLQAVAVMLKTGQALIFDDTTDRYQVVGVGERIAGWRVVAIEATRVVVVLGDERDELPLVAPPRPIEGIVLPPNTRIGPAAAATATATAAELENPYDEPAPAKPAAPPKPARTEKPAPAAPAVSAVSGDGDETAPKQQKLARAELMRELGDFDRLDASVDVVAAPGGGFELTRVDKTSWPYKLGLRQGDVIRAVGGQRVASLDDAARVYAQLRTTKSFTIELDRQSGEATPTLKRRVVLAYTVAGK